MRASPAIEYSYYVLVWRQISCSIEVADSCGVNLVHSSQNSEDNTCNLFMC